MFKYLQVLFISALPIIELRGAIPYSQILGLPFINSIIIAIIGNLLPMPIVYFFAQKVLKWGSNKKYLGKPFKYILEKGHKAGVELTKNNSKGIFIALLIFVAIPLPGTGAYTGMLAASLLDIDFKKSFLAISLGVLGAAIIIIILTSILKMTI